MEPEAQRATQIADAMQAFVRDANALALEDAVARFVSSARSEHMPIEQVLAQLEAIADIEEQNRTAGRVVLERTELRRRMLRGVLLAFYGGEAVEREERAGKDRRIASEDRRRRGIG